MFRQRQAILQLLSDDDPFTVDLVKSQLASHGRESVPDLLDLLQADDTRVARHVHEVLGRIDATEAFDELTALCHDFPDRGELDALEFASFLLARAMAPGCDVDGARRKFDEWGTALAQRLPRATTREQRTALLADFFGRELRFRGETEDYYNAGNSLLPQVVESRAGIPISLALVYLFVGARAGIPLYGVSFPGHFLIRCDGVLLDPFGGGRVVTPSDCAAILERQNMIPKPEYLANASVRIILRRMLANLLYIHQSEDKKLAGILAGWIHDLET